MPERFIRLAAGSAGGVKLCGRRSVNPALSPMEAMDEALFAAQLCARLGAPDKIADASFSYSLLDQDLLFPFEAYSGSSGPAYGAKPSEAMVDFEQGDHRLRPEVLQTLTAFEQWLTAPYAMAAGAHP